MFVPETGVFVCVCVCVCAHAHLHTFAILELPNEHSKECRGRSTASMKEHLNKFNVLWLILDDPARSPSSGGYFWAG